MYNHEVRRVRSSSLTCTLNRPTCAVPFHCADALLQSLRPRVEKVKRSSGSTLGLDPLLWDRLEVKVPKHGRLEAFSVSWVVTSLVPCQRFTTVAAERCRRPCASNKKWTVYELAVQNFLMDAHRDGCMYVLGLRIVVPTALRRPSGRLLRQRRSNPLQTLRRLLCRLLRQRQSIALQTLRRLLCQLLRQRQSTIYGRPIYSDIYHS